MDREDLRRGNEELLKLKLPADPEEGELCDLDEILTGLSWESSLDYQQATIQKLISDGGFDYSFIIQPFGRKDCWGNCAEVFTKLSCDKLEPYIPKLLEWLQDLNWPGALTIHELFKALPREKTDPYINKAIQRSIETNDEIWEENLRDI